ncbi:hypothetical protein DERP_001214 [Dermatophagoides pteronyssinus]|uniref:Uncharacterized protein n=1 Tax=Dermatophagoides pteronyssinus TaxID=6956 RepID=A0ABQ8JEB3_DERPT|nr:hypothetical protein DERP_001214 [Dermatophagoides pteronyssinus]
MNERSLFLVLPFFPPLENSSSSSYEAIRLVYDLEKLLKNHIDCFFFNSKKLTYLNNKDDLMRVKHSKFLLELKTLFNLKLTSNAKK